MNIFQKYLTYGLSVIPCNLKIPAIDSWKQYQDTPATQETAGLWPDVNIACICGRVSGGLVCIDFDVKYGNKWEPWMALINEQYPELLSKFVIESTPSGGYHLIFRSDAVIKNLKLACNKERQATIETRGEGGYFVCAPSMNYAMYYGGFDFISKLTPQETEIVLSTTTCFNEFFQEPKNIPERTRTENSDPNDLSPFDDYDSRHDLSGLLTSNGWRELFRRGEQIFYQRPGKEGRGVSATWNSIPNRFYCFSTATCFPNNTVFKPSAVYAILKFGGDYNAAAKDLYALGFGSRKEKEKKEQRSVIINPKTVRENVLKIRDSGYQKGKSTGWKKLDEYYSVIKGQFTVITGMPSHGKSQFVDALTVNLAMNERWKFAYFSPENYPTEMHYHQIIEKISGQNFWKIPPLEINEIMDFIEEKFFFIDALEEEISLDGILEQTKTLCETKEIDALVIDPWNEIELSKPKDISDSDFIGACLRKCRKFARKYKIHLWIICHPIKMQKDKDGKYPVPELYDCAGSAHWRNKADNGLCVHRDFVNEITEIHIQKIKFRYTGKPGTCELKFNTENGRYEEMNDATRLDF